jgi:hypothetical protein
MLKTVWNPRGFRLINGLEKGRKFSAKNYVTEILSPSSEWRVSDAQKSGCKLILHAYHALPHTVKLSVEFFEVNGMKAALHSPCSPDIAPSDLYPFGYVKGCLTVRSSVDAGAS